MEQPVPGFEYGGVNFLLPADLPEGGFLQVIVGENPMAIPTPSIAIPKGCMVALIPPHVAERLRPELKKWQERMERQRQPGPVQ